MPDDLVHTKLTISSAIVHYTGFQTVGSDSSHFLVIVMLRNGVMFLEYDVLFAIRLRSKLTGAVHDASQVTSQRTRQAGRKGSNTINLRCSMLEANALLNYSATG